MPTRRGFLQSGAVVAAALSGASALDAHGLPAEPSVPGTSTTGTPKPAADVQVPKMKFFNAEISRMVLGVNPFCGYSHYNNNYSGAMKEWYTSDRVCAVMHQAARFGINAFNYVVLERMPQDWLRFRAEGGQMHLIIQVLHDNRATLEQARTLQPLAMFRQGEVVDQAFQQGKMNTVRDWCKMVRDLGIIVGVGTHKPEVITQVEEEGWDVDFYAGCVYNRTRTQDEWRKILNGEITEMPQEIYIQSDPPRMYSVMRQTRKPCFAFKILAAGRVDNGGVEQAFRTAFSSIKPSDGVLVGVFPRGKDEVRENAEIAHRILQG